MDNSGPTKNQHYEQTVNADLNKTLIVLQDIYEELEQGNPFSKTDNPFEDFTPTPDASPNTLMELSEEILEKAKFLKSKLPPRTL